MSENQYVIRERSQNLHCILVGCAGNLRFSKRMEDRRLKRPPYDEIGLSFSKRYGMAKARGEAALALSNLTLLKSQKAAARSSIEK